MKIFIFISVIIFSIIYSKLCISNEIIVKKIYPPKCAVLKETKGKLCPRIMELDIEIKSKYEKQLVRCLLFSEEGEILAFGEAVMRKPGGRIYIELRERRRVHGITLIAGAKCR